MEYVLLSQCKSRWTIKTIGSYARICCGRCAGSFLDNNVVAGVAVAHLEVAVVAVRREVDEEVAVARLPTTMVGHGMNAFDSRQTACTCSSQNGYGW